jgi:hypothetical protein
MMKKIAKKSSLGLATLLITAFISSAVTAGPLAFQGYGGWRDAGNKHGTYTNKANVTWQKCRNLCVSSTSCTGVEFSFRETGKSYCEIHTDTFGHTSESAGVAVVWAKT